MQLKVIKGIPRKERPSLYNLYENAFIKTLDRIINANTTIDKVDLIERKRAVFYGVNMYVHKEIDDLEPTAYALL